MSMADEGTWLRYNLRLAPVGGRHNTKQFGSFQDGTFFHKMDCVHMGWHLAS